MLLSPDENETAIIDAAAECLANIVPIARLHETGACDLGADARKALAELGWFGLAIPEALGGSGLSAIEYALFFREVGRQCGPIDVLAVVLAAVAAQDDPDLCASLVTGERNVAIAVDSDDGYRLLGGSGADLAVHVDLDGVQLFNLIGVPQQQRAALDPGVSMRIVATRQIPVVAARGGEETWVLGELAAAAMLLGIAEATLDQIVEYAKVRETFGRKIGSYQAVRHPCADMALRAEAARCQIWFAAAALKEARSDARAHLDAAKYLVNEAAVRNADTSIQLHGGIGITDEHHAHLFLKHALLLSRIFGTKRVLLSGLLHAELEL